MKSAREGGGERTPDQQPLPGRGMSLYHVIRSIPDDEPNGDGGILQGSDRIDAMQIFLEKTCKNAQTRLSVANIIEKY